MVHFSRMASICFVSLAAAVCAGPAAALELRRDFGGSPAVVLADTQKFAGAISSFRWKGREFLDSTDHGRELQSAVSFDGLGECFNPTEAGSGPDGRGPKSSSRLLRSDVTNGVLNTLVDAAFWHRPGTAVPKGCGWGERPDVKNSTNTSVVGGYLIGKSVKFGYGSVENALDYKVFFEYPAAHQKARAEVLTSYLPIDFDNLYYFDGGSQFLKQPERKPFQRLNGYPVFATSDREFAFGLICHDTKEGGPAEYWAWRNETAKVVKWSCFSTVNNSKAMRYDYQAVVFFGTLQDVQRAMKTLSAQSTKPSP